MQVSYFQVFSQCFVFYGAVHSCYCDNANPALLVPMTYSIIKGTQKDYFHMYDSDNTVDEVDAFTLPQFTEKYLQSPILLLPSARLKGGKLPSDTHAPKKKYLKNVKHSSRCIGGTRGASQKARRFQLMTRQKTAAVVKMNFTTDVVFTCK